MTKIACVLGGAGFLGSHVADKLSIKGYHVRVFDQKPSIWLSKDQEMVIGNLLNPKEVEEVVNGADVVYNFAALADLNEGLKRPIDTINYNILGNANVIEACCKFNVKRFLYASTIYVYSRDGGFYRCSKQASENYLEEYHKVYGLDYTILRFGSIFGPRSDQTNGLYRIVKYAIEQGVVSYEGSEEAIREYIHVEDAAEASVFALHEDFKNENVILTGQETMHVKDMLKMLAEILNIKKKIDFKENKNSGHYIRTPYAYQPKIGKKYIPPLHVDFGQGLIQLINEIRAKKD
jgi:UDP-glucose 4-epimerase